MIPAVFTCGCIICINECPGHFQEEREQHPIVPGFSGKVNAWKRECSGESQHSRGEKSTDSAFSFQTAQGFEWDSPLGTEHCNKGQLGRREPVYTVFGEIRKN